MKPLGPFIRESQTICKTINKLALRPGINDTGNHFVKLSSNQEVEYIIDKVCNHAGGKLILKQSNAVCPMHGWQLNLDTLHYNDSHVCKTKLDYTVDEEGNIRLEDNLTKLVNPFSPVKKGRATVRWLNHAAVYVECNGTSIITDPWLFGPAFMTGWWLAKPSPKDSIDLLRKADYVYISHNHPDHLHPETLALLPKAKQFIIADFTTRSTEKYLRSLGFENMYKMPFNELYEIAPGMQISVLKSGDFRDDSGIYLNTNGHEILLTVDSNFLNSYILPKGIDLLMTSFAGGASGFPLCFENFSDEEKSAVMKRNRAAMKFSVGRYLQETTPKFYMPYAGMFKEYAQRDTYINQHNFKNAISDYASLAENGGAQLLYASPGKELIFESSGLNIVEVETELLEEENPNAYISKLKEEYRYDAAKVLEYFRQSNYHGNQILQIIPTDDNFTQLGSSIVFIDFKQAVYKLIGHSELVESKEHYRVMQLKIRAEVLMCVIENMLPFEDFSIGFQMRVKRFPNEYESEFWYYFTNEYIGLQHFRYASFCGACTTINQNPAWINADVTTPAK